MPFLELADRLRAARSYPFVSSVAGSKLQGALVVAAHPHDGLALLPVFAVDRGSLFYSKKTHIGLDPPQCCRFVRFSHKLRARIARREEQNSLLPDKIDSAASNDAAETQNGWLVTPSFVSSQGVKDNHPSGSTEQCFNC